MDEIFRKRSMANDIKRREKQRVFKKAKRRRNKRLGFLYVLFIASFCVLFYRIYYITTVHGEEFERRVLERQSGTRNVELVLTAHRGNIFDRNMQGLAIGFPVDNIFMDVRRLVVLDEDDLRETLEAINRVLEIPVEILEGHLARNADGQLINDTHFFIIARDVSRAMSSELLDTGIRHVYAEATTRRHYNNDNLASQVIGFIRGAATWGLEHYYYHMLAGADGRQYRVFNEDHNPVMHRIEPIEGFTLITTLDVVLQQIAERAVEAADELYRPQNVAAIIMNPQTGEILAMAQAPTINLNAPDNIETVSGLRHRETLRELADTPGTGNEYWDMLNRIWGNYNISATWEPGSIFKPIVAAAALEEGLINHSSLFLCTGSHEILGETIPCWNEHGHGRLNITQILARSCNVGVMQIVELLGRDTFYRYLRDFGYGERTGIDLPGESSAGARAVFYTLEQWNPVEMAAGSMGQGFNNTAIQAINSVAAVVNGGRLMTPYLVSQVLDHNGRIVMENTPHVRRKVISEETSDFLRVAMQAAVSEVGTASRATIQGFSIGGKTGTAQQGPRDNRENIFSFITYFPVENPEIIALVLLDRPIRGEAETSMTTVVPMMREMMVDIIQHRGIRPTGPIAEIDGINIPAGAFAMDNYVGRDVQEAIQELHELGLHVELIGTGDRIENQQMPHPGAYVTPGTRVFFNLTDSGMRPPMLTVPDLVGHSMEQAGIILEELGLVPLEEITITPGAATENFDDDEYEYYNEAQNIVVEQSPRGGRTVPVGTQVKIISE